MKNYIKQSGCVVAVLFLLGVCGEARAQNSGEYYRLKSARRVKATLALVDKLPSLEKPADALVIRSLAHGDIVVLPIAAASPELLDAATRTLTHSRLVHGIEPPTKVRGKPVAREVKLGVRMSAPPPGRMDKYGGAMSKLLAKARTSPEVTVPGVGSGRMVKFYPPLAQAKK